MLNIMGIHEALGRTIDETYNTTTPSTHMLHCQEPLLKVKYCRFILTMPI